MPNTLKTAVDSIDQLNIRRLDTGHVRITDLRATGTVLAELPPNDLAILIDRLQACRTPQPAH